MMTSSFERDVKDGESLDMNKNIYFRVRFFQGTTRLVYCAFVARYNSLFVDFYKQNAKIYFTIYLEGKACIKCLQHFKKIVKL